MNVMKFANPRFVHLHVHTEYSPQDAPVHLKRLVGRAKDLGYKSLAVTDHGTVGSWVKFQKLCKENEIKPIFGMEGYFVPDRFVKTGKRHNHHIVLLAKNQIGLMNLMKISELAWMEGKYYDPRLDWELLERFGEGIICTSACVSGIIPDTLVTHGQAAAISIAERFKTMFKDDFYIEVQYHNAQIEKGVYTGMAEIAAKTGIKIVGTNDVHYLNRNDANVQEVLMAVKQGKCIKDPNRMKHDVNEYYLKSPEEMQNIFGGANSQACVSTLEIMDKCTAEIVPQKSCLPSIAFPKEFGDDFDYLVHLSNKGLEKLGLSEKKEYQDRLKHELGIVKKIKDDKGLRFDRYFLIVADYVNWAKNNGIIVGPGRGSGAGSLVLYCLGITGLDPLKYQLLFERFLSEDRNEMPDIDVDFDDTNGHKVFEYACEKYGRDHCAKIGTIGQYKCASSIRAAIKLFDPKNNYEKEMEEKKTAQKGIKNKKRNETSDFGKEVSAMLPRDPMGKNPHPKCTLLKEVYEANPDEAIYIYEHPECGQFFKNLKRQYPEIMRMAESLEGLADKRSIHASGVLITETPTVQLVPQQPAKKEKEDGYQPEDADSEFATVWDMLDIEAIGGIKFDFLSIKGLSVIALAIKMAKENHGCLKDSIGRVFENVDKLPDDDPNVLKMFADGNTLAIFQFESDGMVKTLREMKPTKFEHIIAANALFRPGPMEYIGTYNARKHGTERISYPAESVKAILEPTYGIMVYQEQVMQITSVLGGFSGSEADKVRKAMGKKKRDVLDKMKDKFINGAKKLNTCPESVAAQVWTDMEAFASYAFNKSHAAAYSYISYQMAWLKTYYPHEFMAAQLTIESGGTGNGPVYETVDKYERGCKKMGIEILPIDLNKSKIHYSTEEYKGKTAIRRGLCGVKGIGYQAACAIAVNAPYKDMMDFCNKAEAGCKSNAVEVLVAASAFDCFLEQIKRQLGGRFPTNKDIMDEYLDKKKRASNLKRHKKDNKEELEGIPTLFSMLENSAAKKPTQAFSIDDIL